MATALHAEYDLTVISPLPSHPTPDYFTETDTETHDRELAFTVLRCDSFRPHTSGFLRRGLREALMATTLARSVVRDTDVVIATSPSFFVAPTAMLVSMFYGARFHWDVRDLTWEYAQAVVKDLDRRKRIRHTGSAAMRWAAGIVARRADSVIASNIGIAEYFEQSLSCRNVHVARNGVSQKVFKDLGAARDQASRMSPFCVSYIGALGYFQALDILLEAAEALPDVEFRIVGDGPERRQLTRLAADRQLDNVTFVGFVDRASVYEEYSRADVLFAQLRDLEVMDSSTVPSKIYEYLASGKPIIYAGNGITASYLRETDGARIIAPQQPDQLIAAVNELRVDQDLRNRMGQSGRDSLGDRIREDIMKEAVRRITTYDRTPLQAPQRIPESLREAVTQDAV